MKRTLSGRSQFMSTTVTSAGAICCPAEVLPGRVCRKRGCLKSGGQSAALQCLLRRALAIRKPSPRYRIRLAAVE